MEIEYESSALACTHLNTDVGMDGSIGQLLPELVIWLLAYGEVTINDGDIIHNPLLVEYLGKPANMRIFQELIASGGLTIRTLPPEQYPDDLREMALRDPLIARVEESKRQKTRMHERWEPTEAESHVFATLSKSFQQRRVVKPAAPYPAGRNLFVESLSGVLKAQPRLAQYQAFGGISPAIADTFLRFCVDDEASKRFLREQNERTPDSMAFGRSLAYRCAHYFPDAERSLRNLFQAVFADTYCENHNMDGRYGGRLVELPMGDPEPAENGSDVIEIRLERTDSRFTIPLGQGLGEALAATRESPRFASFQNALRDTAVYNPEKVLGETWYGLIAEFQEQLARRVVLPRMEETVWWGAGSAVFGLEIAKFVGFGVDVLSPASNVAIGGLTRVGRAVSLAMRRGRVFDQTEGLKRALEVRTLPPRRVTPST